MLVNSILVAGLVAATQVAASPCKPPPKYKPIESIQLGPRPYWLVDDMSDSPVKKQLEECKDIKEFKPSAWSIAHRGGGTLFMPEHSVESNLAGARMGAGVLEAAYAQQLIDEYRQAGIDPRRVWPQSFHYPDILYWLDNEPAFGAQAVYLDENGETAATFPDAVANLTTYKADGVRIVAPPLPYLVTLDDGGRIVPSAYATRANELGLEIITWSLERSGVLSDGTKGGYYYTTIADAIQTDGDVFELLHVLAKDIGVLGVFSDWSATVTYYANCLGLF
ncbi:glycerophosphoryl diester phosphodiesterase [Verticillium dahliae]